MVNVSGISLSDCFKCQEEHLTCDRVKPRCNQCIDTDVVCPGYKQQLSWNNGLASRGRFRGKLAPVDNPQQSHVATTVYETLSWKIDAHKATKRPYKRKSAIHSCDKVTKETSVIPNAAVIDDTDAQHIYDFFTGSYSPSAMEQFEVMSALSSPLSYSSRSESSPSPNAADTAASILAASHSKPSIKYALSPELPELWKELLHDYTNSFCGTPVTSDFAKNPYRAAIGLARSSNAVLHAILGFSIHHSNILRGQSPNQELIATHRNMCLQELQGTIKQDPSTGFITIMLLITLDSTQSAIGEWESLIKSSSELLRTDRDKVIDGPEGLSRLAMLLWFDITVALIARKANQIDHEFYDILFSKEARLSHMDFFNLVGCDKEIFAYLILLVNNVTRLKQGARIMQIVKETQEIKTSLLKWSLPEDLNTDKLISQSGDELQISLDKVHCMESWRWAALLYIEQVFNGSTEADYYKHQVFDHARCISRVDVIQKQVLLPLFLAGAQTTAKEQVMRGFISEYCIYWGDACRFKMFNTMGHMLDILWSRIDHNENSQDVGHGSTQDSRLFWGDVLDETSLGSILLG